MKQLLFFAVLPILAYCDPFSIVERESDTLRHMEVEVDLEETLDETQNLSLFEIDESDESLIPWSAEDLARDDSTHLLGRKAAEDYEEFEDAFSYEIRCYGEGVEHEPTYEKVSKRRGHLLHRPKIIESPITVNGGK